MTEPTSLTYRDAGVDIDAGEDLVERIKPRVARTQRPEVLAGIGGFGAMIEIPEGRWRRPVLVAGTDGVGTKLRLAIDTGMHDGVGQDLAGFCVGVVERDRIIDGRRTAAGDAVIGLASSGPHSNGYSLIRRLLADTGADASTRVGGAPLIERLLAPTRIYVKPLLALAAATDMHAFAHITVGGLTDNAPRVLPDGLGVRLDPRAWRREPVWEWIQASGHVSDAEMHRTFNCGIGMVVIVAPADVDGTLAHFGTAGEQAAVIGEVVTGAGVQFG